jgi:signal transduction histidine kinase
MASLVKPGATVIALSLRIDNDDGSMKGFITTVLSQDRLGAILAQQSLPDGWVSGLYDRRFLPIVTLQGLETSSNVALGSALQAQLTSRDPNSNAEGIVEGLDDRGIPVLVAYRTSGATNWTSVVTVPVALVNAPVRNILWQMAWPAAVLLLAGGLAALFTARHVERPIETLSRQVIEAEDEITQLSEQLLALQEEERQNIARELHDSTAQGLVAANLGLARLGREVEQKSPAARATLAQIEALLDQALQELRTFTYLLHPPNLAEDGLKRTLQEFVGGFAGRAGLRVRIRISDRIDETQAEIQRCILRVVQEALANVHRHAGASQVCVDAKPTGGRLVIRIRDDGGGIFTPNAEGSERRPRMGVGIPGMRARLRQFGGDLRIRSGVWGTSVVAYVELPVVSPSAVLAA